MKIIFFILITLNVYADNIIKNFASLAVHSYDKNFVWFNNNNFEILDYNEGLNLYVVSNSNKQIYILFRGTNSLKDVMFDGLQHFGLSKYDFKNKIAYKGLNEKYLNSSEYIKKYINSKPILIGHSLGGGIATYCGLLYGLNTIAFNPAPLSQETLKNLNLENSNKIINYVSYNEFQPDLVSGSSLLKNQLIGKINMVHIPLEENLTQIQRIRKIHSMKELYNNI